MKWQLLLLSCNDLPSYRREGGGTSTCITDSVGCELTVSSLLVLEHVGGSGVVGPTRLDFAHGVHKPGWQGEGTLHAHHQLLLHEGGSGEGGGRSGGEHRCRRLRQRLGWSSMLGCAGAEGKLKVTNDLLCGSWSLDSLILWRASRGLVFLLSCGTVRLSYLLPTCHTHTITTNKSCPGNSYTLLGFLN